MKKLVGVIGLFIAMSCFAQNESVFLVCDEGSLIVSSDGPTYSMERDSSPPLLGLSVEKDGNFWTLYGGSRTIDIVVVPEIDDYVNNDDQVIVCEEAKF